MKLDDLPSMDKSTVCFELSSGLCKCINVYDGDTCTVLIVYPGMSLPIKHQVRLYGIDTPELRLSKTTENREEKLARSIAARDRLSSMILDKVVSFTIRGNDKYHRLLASLYVDGRDVSQVLIEEGLGVPYFGGTKSGDL